MNTDPVFLQTIEASWLTHAGVSLEVLRLDVMHPVVSGNKWFKLKYYIQHAKENNKTLVATFGGAYSNHIIACAWACKNAGLKSLGFIRGEEAPVLSPTLRYAETLGMQLVFVSREQYKNKEALLQNNQQAGWLVIPEGGYGTLGALGATEILQLVDSNQYTHFIASVGTGTMLAGLLMAADKHTEVIGISSMKGNESLEQAVKDLLTHNKKERAFTLFHNYHFGGYAKHPPLLIAFINQAWHQFQLPLDIVYTGKLFFAIMDLVTRGYFPEQSKLLMIHSGGLQGNDSLPKNNLSFT